jgi:hypothetical protein
LSHLGWLDINKQPFTADKLKEIVTYQRGSDDRSKNLRIKIEIPETYNYTLGDCFIGGASLDWVCQVIDSSGDSLLDGYRDQWSRPGLPVPVFEG